MLCPGYNDGPALEKTLEDLGRLWPNLQSIACVPVGLTRYRQGLTPLEPFTQAGAARVIDTVHRFAGRMQREHGERVAYPSDEFFLKAQRPLPPASYYGEFDQLENGVGLLALLEDEFTQAMEADDSADAAADLTVVTGVAAWPLLRSLADRVERKHPGVRLRVQAVVNRVFGELITVAGLVTGQDILQQLAGKPLGQGVLLPGVMLRHEQDRFLDDLTLEELQSRLGVPVTAVENDGWTLYSRMCGRG